MLIPIPLRQLEPRQSSDPPTNEHSNNGTEGQNNPTKDGSGSGNNNVVIIIAAIVVFVVAFLVIVYFVLRALRKLNCRPKYIPGKYLKDRWNRWNVGASYGQVPGGSSPNRAGETATAQTAEGGPQTESDAGIRRDTSIRSIITLPAYSSTPKPTEQVIAREGERGGMDVVVEFPETAEEEEERREEMMESLYQIRLQRRQEIAEREARRRERREARERGDIVRLEQLRAESRRARANSRESVNGSTSVSAATALAEAQSRGRDRRISSVTYADVGYVRHDGSRVRASSRDSDSRPLLNDAAAMSEGPDRSSGFISVHSRGESYSSALSDGEGLTPTQSYTTSLHSAHNQNEQPEDGDVGARNIPPPDYDNLDWGEAPPYEPPPSELHPDNPPRLRELTPLPTIQIEVASPISNDPPTPITQREEESAPATAGTFNHDSASRSTSANRTTESGSEGDNSANPPRG